MTASKMTRVNDVTKSPHTITFKGGVYTFGV